MTTNELALMSQINSLENQLAELRERCAFYERTNAEQVAMLTVYYDGETK